MKDPRGLTVVEVLVVIAVIGILLALILPAVQRSREAARVTQCRTNLKQLGLATQTYIDANGILPQSDSLSIFVALTPYLDQPDLYELADFGRTWRHQSRELNERRPDVLGCPSDWVVDQQRHRNSYAGNSGDHHAASTKDKTFTPTWPRVGVFTYSFESAPFKPADITDGLSQTAMFSELLPVVDKDLRRSMWVENAPVLQVRPIEENARLCLDVRRDGVDAL